MSKYWKKGERQNTGNNGEGKQSRTRQKNEGRKEPCTR